MIKELFQILEILKQSYGLVIRALESDVEKKDFYIRKIRNKLEEAFLIIPEDNNDDPNTRKNLN